MMPFEFPAAPHVRRHGPRGYASAEKFRPWLRDEFEFRCVYCLTREAWMNRMGTFAIDHFLPASLAPDKTLDYDNLLYTCISCNLAKGAQLTADPTRVLLASAVTMIDSGRFESEVPGVRAIIAKLGLNDPQSIEFRRLWVGILRLARDYEPSLFKQLSGWPDDLPDLARLRPPGGNSRPAGIAASCLSRRDQNVAEDTLA
jgi:hypothetical protein